MKEGARVGITFATFVAAYALVEPSPSLEAVARLTAAFGLAFLVYVVIGAVSAQRRDDSSDNNESDRDSHAMGRSDVSLSTNRTRPY